MDDRSATELRALQLRIYGPDADLRDDDVALRRLQELEARAAVRQEPTADAVGPESGQPADRDPKTAPVPDPPAATEAEAPASPLHATRIRWSRATLAALWAVSVVVACVVAVGTAQTLAQPGTRQVATLSVDPEATWPTWLLSRQSGVDLFEEYHGLSIIAVPAGVWGRDDSARCIIVVVADREEYVGDGCGAGDFRATVPVLITATSPEPLREKFGVGTALEFHLEDDSTVIVRSDAG